MKNPIPSIKHPYTDEDMAKLQPAQQTAARYGVDPLYLKFASSASASDIQEEYALHNFSTLHIGSKVVTHDDQFNDALQMLDNGCLWGNPASVIIVNAPKHLFPSKVKYGEKKEKKDDPYLGPVCFISHLACSLAYRVSTKRIPHSVFSYLDMTGGGIDLAKGYDRHPRNLFVWGPITDHSNSFDYSKTIQFLYAFRSQTRILLTSTPDLESMLDKLHMHVDHVSYFFNFASEKGDSRKELTKTEKQIEIVKEAKEKKAKAKEEGGGETKPKSTKPKKKPELQKHIGIN